MSVPISAVDARRGQRERLMGWPTRPVLRPSPQPTGQRRAARRRAFDRSGVTRDLPACAAARPPRRKALRARGRKRRSRRALPGESLTAKLGALREQSGQTAVVAILDGSSLTPFSTPGLYVDSQGSESIEWSIIPSRRRSPPGHGPGYELHTTIRGVACWGYDFDGLEPADREEAVAVGLSVDDFGNLIENAVSGDLPCVISRQGTRSASTVNFELRNEEGPRLAAGNLSLRLHLDDVEYQVVDDWFEDGVQRLEAALPGGVQLVCCVTCLFSDYSPGGHGLMGMSCHRGAKEQYLAVRSKADYWSVPVTEDVMETHLCEDYERRTPGTGYRG